MKKRIAVLGSTGSIGTQALHVINNNPDKFKVEVLTAKSNADLLIEQAVKFKPTHIVIADKQKYNKVNDALSDLPINVHAGEDSIKQVVGLDTVVVAGKQVTELAKKNKVHIYPVDSEHSAIFQCLAGENNNAVEKIYLTASGGPFRGMSYNELEKVTKEQALVHPNWCMGNKITIDSATLMNKGMEVIEAKWLFDIDPSHVEVVVHPQSIIHSIVQFKDGSMKAQMGLPDMHLQVYSLVLIIIVSAPHLPVNLSENKRYQ